LARAVVTLRHRIFTTLAGAAAHEEAPGLRIPSMIESSKMHNPNLPPQLPEPEVSTATGFALMLETACEDFEILQRMIRQEIKLVSGNGIEHRRASPRIQMALAKSFLFNLVRARRICDLGAGSLTVDRAERKRFLNATAAVVNVRDVNEHGFDVNKISKPSMHSHAKENAILDETAMAVLGDQKILMGPLNLYNVYVPTDRMRKLAGFRSLRPAFPQA
jgi:hypothetical protein